MRYQPKKRKQLTTPLVILISLAVMLTIYIVAINSPDKQPERPLQPESEYKTYEYVVTHVKGNEVYGKSTDGTGIFFTSSELERINVNDRIVAYFEPSDLIQMVKVEKVNE